MSAALKRIAELKRLFIKIYEDNAKGKLSDERFDMMSQSYETEQKQLERERQRAGAQTRPAPAAPAIGQDGDYAQIPPDLPTGLPQQPVSPEPIIITNKDFAPCERDLLKFILEEGCSQLKFDRDSKYYIEGESITVAEFIDATLAEDSQDFENPSYRKVYEEYFRMYDEGLSQEQIQKRLLDSMDAEVAAVAKALLIDKYQITVANYEKSLTSSATILVQFVPKTLMTYQVVRLNKMIQELMASLGENDDLDAQVEILARINDLTRTRTVLNNQLGRV